MIVSKNLTLEKTTFTGKNGTWRNIGTHYGESIMVRDAIDDWKNDETGKVISLERYKLNSLEIKKMIR